MKPTTIGLCGALIVAMQGAQGQNFWQPSTEKTKGSAAQLLLSQGEAEVYLNRGQPVELILPTPDGNWVTYMVRKSQLMAPELAAKFPDINTYSGYQVDAPDNIGHFDLSEAGFHGMFDYQGRYVFIDPTSSAKSYRVSARTQEARRPWIERVIGQSTQLESRVQSDGQKRTYRLAMAATGEYTQFHGGAKSQGMAAIVTMVGRLNQVYSSELAIEFQLIGDNDKLVFTDPATDPFSNSDADIDSNDATLNSLVGNANYDVGHLVGTFGGGVAALGSVCSSEKAAGVTGSEQPNNDAFYIDYVAHELGHQFGAEHTFNGTAGSCGGGNRAQNFAYEPGSGSTIMAYTGICDDEDLQSNSDAYFHAASLSQIFAFVSSGTGNSCGTKQPQNNQAPVVNAGADYSIPVNTPFLLTGSATDADGDMLSYAWEQWDTGAASSSKQTMVDNGDRPIFRSWAPTATPIRYFPRLQDVLTQTLSTGEAYPTTTRAMTFRLTVRDGKGNSGFDDVRVNTVQTASRFAVTTPTSWAKGQSQTLSWQSGETAQAPINCANVDVLLSTNNGASFAHTLLSNTPNDGSQAVVTPAIDTGHARIMLKCSDNIFYSMSARFAIGDASANQAPEITGQNTLTTAEDVSREISLNDLTVAGANYPSGFTLHLAAGNHYQVSGNTITPATDFNGELSIDVRVNDGIQDSNNFQLRMSVTPVNDAPECIGDKFELSSGTQTLDVLANDRDVDGDNLTLSSLQYSGPGRASIDDQRLVYTPVPNSSSDDSLIYIASDGKGASCTAKVDIVAQSSDSGAIQVQNDTLGGLANSASSEDISQGAESGSGGAVWWLVVLMAAVRMHRRCRC